MIHIIIPVFNRLTFTIRCIDSLLTLETEIRIYLVDDGSTDGTFEYISDCYPDVIIVSGTGSLFWTGAVRKGIEYVLEGSYDKDDFIALINNDVVIKDTNILNSLISHCEFAGRRAICAPLTLSVNQPCTTITTGVAVDSWLLNKTSKFYHKKSLCSLSTETPINVDFLTGRLLIHPIEIFSAIGNYDSFNFPHYGGDDEFSIRAKRAGFHILVIPNLYVYLIDEKKGIQQSIFTKLFNKRSSINLRDKIMFSLKVVPLYAVVSYLLISIFKSVVVAFLRK